MEMGEGREVAIVDALHAAEREDRWLVIEHIELISRPFFLQLNQHLSRIAASRGESATGTLPRPPQIIGKTSLKKKKFRINQNSSSNITHFYLFML